MIGRDGAAGGRGVNGERGPTGPNGDSGDTVSSPYIYTQLSLGQLLILYTTVTIWYSCIDIAQ